MSSIELPLTLVAQHPTVIPAHHRIVAGVQAIVESRDPMLVRPNPDVTPAQAEAITQAIDHLMQYHPIDPRIASTNELCRLRHEENLESWAQPIWRARAEATLSRWGLTTPTLPEYLYVIVRAVNTARAINELPDSSPDRTILRAALGADTHYLLENVGMPKGPATAGAHNRNPDNWAKEAWFQLAEHLAQKYDS